VTAIKSPLDEQARATTGKALQGTLIDLLDLSLQAKQAHWNLIGKHFRSLHLQLDDVVATARTYSDTVAERAVAIGINPDGRAETIAQHSALDHIEGGYLQDDKVVAAFIERLTGIVSRMRQRVEATEKSDLITQDLLISVTADLEQHLWMFEAQR
jgi:starvation-inducible DNA-binding protein